MGMALKYGKQVDGRPTISNETILATRQEFFFTKVAPVQSITAILVLDFLLMLLSWMFILSYTSIYFFGKEIYFLNVSVSVNTMYECLYMFSSWKRDVHVNVYKKKTGIQMFKIPSWHKIENATLFLNVSSKNLEWKQHFYTDTFWNYILLNVAVWWGCISRRGKGRGGKGASMSNLFLINHHWYDVEKLTVPGSSNLNLNFSVAQQKNLC